MLIEGGCLCGAVRYESALPPRASALCHCRSCRLSAGAPSVAWLVVPAAGFRFLAGEASRYASSPGVERSFCGRCGTSLTYSSARRPEVIDVTTASLDAPDAHPPTKEIWTAEHLAWEALNPALAQFPGSSVPSA
jgi:hypothetical protein